MGDQEHSINFNTGCQREKKREEGGNIIDAQHLTNA